MSIKINAMSQQNQGEIAAKLSIFSALLITLGLVVGVNSARISSGTTYAATTCGYSFENPTLSQIGGTLICTVPTSGQNIPTVGCSLAAGGQWAADSKLLGGEGSTMRFELALYEGNGSGTYDLIAYEFDQYCSHEDKVVQVFVTAPSPATNQAATPSQIPTPTPTVIPQCILQNQGTCMSQALCLASTSNTSVGDYGCSAIRKDWVCCQTQSAPSAPLLPTSTPQPTATPLPTHTPSPVQNTAASKNVQVTKQGSCPDMFVASSNRQSWAYRLGIEGVFEVVPVLGSTNKQQLVDATCE